MSRKRTLFVVVGIVGIMVLIAGCTATQQSLAKTQGSAAARESASNQGMGTSTVASGEVKEFRIEAFEYGFNPSVIEVNQGDRVRIIAKSLDEPHGLAIPEFGVNLYLDEGGEEQVVEFIADKRGSFPFYCSVYCGGGHGAMRGQLVVN